MFLNDVRFVQNLKKTFKLFKQFKGKAANLLKLESYFINFYILCAEKQVNVLNQSRRHVFISWLTFLLFLIESPTLTAGTKTESW